MKTTTRTCKPAASRPPVRYQFPWDGRTVARGGQDNAVAFDTETEVLEDRALVPRLALASASDGRSRHCLVQPTQMADWVLAHRGQHLVCHNASFDFWVVERHLALTGREDARLAWWEQADAGRLHDTMLLDMLLRLGGGVGWGSYLDEDLGLQKRNLDEVARQYAGVPVDKKDPFRMRYGELLGVPWESVKETGFWDYAMKDAVVTAWAYSAQVREAKELLKKVRKQKPRYFGVAPEARWGYLTESLQVRAAVALAAVERRGIRVAAEAAAPHEVRLRADLESAYAEMRAMHPELFQTHKKTGAILLTPKAKTPRLYNGRLTELLEAEAVAGGFEPPLSPGKKGGTSRSAKSWKEYEGRGGPFLKVWVRSDKVRKMLGFFDVFHGDEAVVRPKYSVLMRTGRTSCHAPNLQNCVDAWTQVLTNQGWAYFPQAVAMAEAGEELLVAQWDDGKVEFVKPDGWVCKKWSKPLIALENDHVDLALTPDHRCPLRARSKKGGKVAVYKASEYPEDLEQLHAGVYAGGKGVEGVDSEEALAYVLCFQADGSWGRKPGDCDFTIKLPRKVERLRAIFKSLALEYTEKKAKGKGGEGKVRFALPAQPFTKRVYELLGADKVLGPWLLDLPRGLLDHFCEEVWFWDATAEDQSQYASEHKRNADWVQTVLSLSGRRAQVRCYDSASGKPSWQVDHTEDTDCSSTTGVNKGKANAAGNEVYCVTVPSGMFLCRRGGKVCVTGNCPRDADFRSFFVPRAGRKFLTIDFAYIELVTLAATCEKVFGFSRLAEVIRDGIDPHEYTASMMRGVSLEEFRGWKKTDPATYKADRQSGKAVGFGAPGGLGAVKLAAYAKAGFGVDMTVEEAAVMRHKLITEVYPELSLYLGDETFQAMAWNTGLTLKTVHSAFGVGKEEDPEKIRRMARAMAKVLRGLPIKADGTPYRPQFVQRVWDGLSRLVGRTSKIPKAVKEQVRTKLGDRRLELALLADVAVTLTGRIRGGCTYTQTRNCVDAETEALTLRGWVKGFDLTKEDTLLTKNADTGCLEWQKVTDVKHYPDYEGPLIEFKSRSFSAVSTPDHRWLVRVNKTGLDACKTTERISLNGDDRIHRTGHYEGPMTSPYSDDFVELCGWVLTDGCLNIIPRVTKEGTPKATVCQSERANPLKLARMEGVVNRLGVLSSKTQDKRNTLVSFVLKTETARRLHAMFPGRVLTVPFLLSLTQRQLWLLFETMVDGDGCRTGGRIRFCCRDANRAGMFQFLCMLIGRASRSVWRDLSKYSPVSAKMNNIPKMTGCWYVYVLTRERVQVVRSQRRDFVAKQPVWCPMVPNTYFVARRNGGVYISGNSPFQGLAADGAKLAQWWLAKGGYEQVGFIHDEVLVEVPEDRAAEAAEEVKRILVRGMSEVLDGALPVGAEGHVGDYWKKA